MSVMVVLSDDRSAVWVFSDSDNGPVQVLEIDGVSEPLAPGISEPVPFHTNLDADMTGSGK